MIPVEQRTQVENPLIDRVPREAYLMLWYLHKRTLEEAA